jgi:polar amino acid transport system ATP-binding protein
MTVLLSIRALGKSFGPKRVLNDINLDLAEGQVMSIIGSSGSGKTTLLRCVNLLEDFEEGEILLDGAAIGYRIEMGRRRRLPESELARQRSRTGMVFQSFNLNPHLTALGNVMLGLVKVRGIGRQQARSEAMSWLTRVGLADHADHHPAELSGGQQQRVAIARALAMNPRLVLLDEITSALDPELVQEVLQTVKSLAREGTTMLIVTHEMRFARDISDRIVFMDRGEIAEEGPARSLFAEPQTARLQDFLRNSGV